MNKLYTRIILIATALFFMSNSGGRGSIGNEAVTASPGETGRTCGSNNCHDDGQFNPTIALELLSPTNGESKSEYKLGRNYTARLTVSASGAPGGYGFQMVALNDAGESVGEWTSGSSTQTVTLGGKSYIEHSGIIDDPVIEVNWTSPIEDQGEVTFYASANAVNANGSPGGDGSTNSSFGFGYDGTLSTENELLNQKLVYPNPAFDLLNVKNYSTQNYVIYNTQGRQVQQGSTINNQIDINQLNPGMYMLQMGQKNGISRFVKL